MFKQGDWAYIFGLKSFHTIAPHSSDMFLPIRMAPSGENNTTTPSLSIMRTLHNPLILIQQLGKARLYTKIVVTVEQWTWSSEETWRRISPYYCPEEKRLRLVYEMHRVSEVYTKHLNSSTGRASSAVDNINRLIVEVVTWTGQRATYI